MNETFDTEVILREILEVLQKHKIPVQTAALNISILDMAFDELIPHLKTYKAGHFHKPSVVDNVPMLFHAQRRYPFDVLVQSLEERVITPTQAFAETLQREFPNLAFTFNVNRVTEHPLTIYKDSYHIGVDCRFSDDLHADYNELSLSISLQQLEATTYPLLDASVGWLVDEESEGDWGLDIVQRPFYDNCEFTPHILVLLVRSLSSLFRGFREEIRKKQAGEL